MSDIFRDAEPARDAAFAALLGEVVGSPPESHVDWTALASRIAAARGRQRGTWWSHAARWERRAIPVAVAAGLAGILTLWSLGMPAMTRTASASPADPIAAIVDGTPADDAARSYARSVTGSADATIVELY